MICLGNNHFQIKPGFVFSHSIKEDNEGNEIALIEALKVIENYFTNEN